MIKSVIKYKTLLNTLSNPYYGLAKHTLWPIMNIFCWLQLFFQPLKSTLYFVWNI